MMKVVTRFDRFVRKAGDWPLALAIGNFDGVHAGHREIFRVLKAYADRHQMISSVFTFQNHPQHVLKGKGTPEILTSFHHKLSLLADAGISLCFAQEFTEEFAQCSAENFVKTALVEKLGVRAIGMGFNSRFGKNRSGDIPLLKRLAPELNFKFLEAPPVKIDGVCVSSSLIREKVKTGDLEGVLRFLGRPYSIHGKITPGSGRGKSLGYPTANLDLEGELMPPEGVYAVWFHVIQKKLGMPTGSEFSFDGVETKGRFPGVMNYGKRPTFGRSEKAVAEVHLLNFRGELSGKEAEVIFIKKIREEKHFANQEELCKQIGRDVEEAKKAFPAHFDLSGHGESVHLPAGCSREWVTVEEEVK